MKDGIYRVNYKGICAGFVIRGQKVVLCAPILAKRLAWWFTIADYLGPEGRLSVPKS